MLHLHGARLSFPKLHRLVAKGFVDVLQTPFFPVQPFFEVLAVLEAHGHAEELQHAERHREQPYGEEPIQRGRVCPRQSIKYHVSGSQFLLSVVGILTQKVYICTTCDREQYTADF